jgi:hypothetical protein
METMYLRVTNRWYTSTHKSHVIVFASIEWIDAPRPYIALVDLDNIDFESRYCLLFSKDLIYNIKI